MNTQNNYIEEEITLAELSDRFLLNNDFTTPQIFDTEHLELEVFTDTGYKKIKSFVVKPETQSYYTDGNLKGTDKHIIIEGDKEIQLRDHQDFTKVDSPMKVVDIEVEGSHYYANGRLNHNTTPGGKALPFHASVRIRLKTTGQIANKDGDIIGMKTEAKVIKNRMGPPFKKAEFDVYFRSGIDNYGNWLERLQQYKVFKTAKVETKDESGKKKTKAQIELEKAALKKEKNFQFDYTDETLETKEGDPITVKEVIQFERKNFLTLLEERPEIKDFLYMHLCKNKIFKYNSPDDKENSEFSETFED